MQINFGTFGFGMMDETAIFITHLGSEIIERVQTPRFVAPKVMQDKVMAIAQKKEPLQVTCKLENGDMLIFKNNAYLRFEEDK